MAIKLFLLFPQEDDDILMIDSPQIVQELIQTILKLRQIIRQYSQDIELFYDSQNIKTFLQKIGLILLKNKKVDGYWLIKPISI